MNDSPEISQMQSLCTGLFSPPSRKALLLSLLGIFGSIAAFCATCFRYLGPYPYLDDYHATLGFMDTFVKQPTRFSKFCYILSAQHNQYKLIYMNAITVLQYKLTGHIDFIFLSILGDLQVLALAWLLWRCFLPAQINARCRSVLFLPIALMLFQLNYAEAVNFNAASPMCIGVVSFALLSIWAASHPSRRSMVMACIAFGLAIAASGNGFGLFPIGLLMFFQQHKPWRIAIWILCTALYGAFYFHGYSVAPTGPALTPHPHNPFYLLGFALSYIGAAAGIQVHGLRYLSILLGLALTAACVMAVKRRYVRINPTIFYYGLFLLLTALAVAGMRGSLGYDASLSGRYKIYSDLMLICCYSFGLHELAALTPARRQQTFKMVLWASFLFVLLGDAFGIRYLHKHKIAIAQGIALYQASGGTQGPMYPNVNDPDPSWSQYCRDILKQTAKDNLYHLP
jgi:hypothetical protein